MTSAPTAPAAQAQGILLMCLGVAMLSVNDAIAKLLTSDYNPLQILFLRNVIALPFAMGIAAAIGGRAALGSRRPLAHVARGALWVGATMLFFTSLSRLGLAEATALIFAAPFFITLISALVLGEIVGWRRWLAVLAGFSGVLVIVRPGGEAFQPVLLLPVAAAFTYALLMLSARWLDPRDSVWTLLVWLTGTGALLGAILVPLVWVPVRAADLPAFAGIAFFGVAGMTMITQAFRLAPAVVVAPLDYTGLLWATLFGWAIWRESPDELTWLGAAIIIASGVATILREQRSAA
ncbi:DMT family transporter [Wenxinia saemankumensis]|nr:DMT family transporter [Wenxinia saemankumensis]